MPRRNRRSTRSGQVPRPVQRSIRNLRHLENNGSTRTGPSDPPRICYTPWNTITLSSLVIGAASASNVCVTVANLYTYLANQMGFTGTQTVAFRVLSAQCWHIIPNGELNNTVRARFYSLLNLTTSCELVRVLATLDDYGTPARNATVRYQWPLTHSANILASSSENNILRLTLGPAQQVLLHVRVMWRGVGGASSVSSCESGRLTVGFDPINQLFHKSESIADLDQLVETFQEL